MGIDWDYWLGRKYANEEAKTGADVTRANAEANLNQVRAGLLPAQTAQDIAESQSRANATDVNAQLAPGLAKASEAQSYGSARANIAQAGLYSAQAAGERQDTSTLSRYPGLVDNPIIQRLLSRLGGGLTLSGP